LTVLYLDTSAVIPYYRPEHASSAVQRLLMAEKTPVAISVLVEVEVASTLARLVRMKELDEQSARLIQSAFAEDMAAGRYLVHALTSAHFALARDWLLGRKTPLRTLDALHLACAVVSEARLATLDRTLAGAGKKLGVAVTLVK
jgi:predicted nucleic acid-binding protein